MEVFGHSTPPTHGANVMEACRLWGGAPRDWVDYSNSINPWGIPDDALTDLLHDAIPRLKRYPEIDYMRLRKRLGARHETDSENIWPLNGSVEGIHAIMRAIAPEVVVAPAPSFREYGHAARRAASKCVEPVIWGPLAHRQARSEIDTLVPHRGCLILANPNSPTGETIARDSLIRLVDTAATRSAVLIIDEAFLPFSSAENDSLAAEATVREHLIVLRSITKSHGLPGIRLGYAVAAPRIIERIRNAVAPWAVNEFAAAVGENLDLFEREIRAQLTRLRAESERFFLVLKGLAAVDVFPSAANFFLCRLRGGSSGKLRESLAADRFLIRSCADYAGLGDEYFRLAVLAPETNDGLLAALRRVIG